MKKLGKDGSATAIWLEWNLVLPASKGCLNISSTVCLVQKADSALEAEGTSVFFFKKKKKKPQGIITNPDCFIKNNLGTPKLSEILRAPSWHPTTGASCSCAVREPVISDFICLVAMSQAL